LEGNGFYYWIAGRKAGINNKFKDIKGSAFGFRDFNYFKLKIKFSFGKGLRFGFFLIRIIFLSIIYLPA